MAKTEAVANARTSIVKKFFLTIIIYIYIFPFKPIVLPYFSELVLAGVALYTFIVCFLDGTLRFKTKHFHFPFFYLFFALVSLVSIVVNRSDDFNLPFILVQYIGSFFVAYSIVVYAERNNFIGRDLVLNSISISGFAMAVSCLLYFLIPEFKQVVEETIVRSGNIDFDSEEILRARGLSTGGGSALSFALSICMMASLAISRRCGSYFYLIVAVVTLLGALVVGRSGFFIGLAAFLIYVLFSKLRPSVMLLLGGMVLLVPVLVDLVGGYYGDSFIDFLYGYSLEPVKLWIEEDRFESKSTNHLLTMFYLPKGMHLLVGAGFYRYPTFGYELSDSGYIKAIFGLGLPVAFLLFLTYVLAAVIMHRFWRLIIGPFSILIVVAFFVYEIKQPGFIQNYGSRVFLLLLMVALLNNYKVLRK